jgi:hypothetical protein
VSELAVLEDELDLVRTIKKGCEEFARLSLQREKLSLEGVESCVDEEGAALLLLR